jgi:3-dehydroquinate synthase
LEKISETQLERIQNSRKSPPKIPNWNHVRDSAFHSSRLATARLLHRRRFAASNPDSCKRAGRRRATRKVLVVLEDSLAQSLQPELSRSGKLFLRARRQLQLVCSAASTSPAANARKIPTHPSPKSIRKLTGTTLTAIHILIAIGGGALLDVAGFAAATAHRGVRHVRIPTTTLSQADSGVGVKNGINAFGKKNFIGTFAPPFAVINDFNLLATLKPRDKRAGYVEA